MVETWLWISKAPVSLASDSLVFKQGSDGRQGRPKRQEAARCNDSNWQMPADSLKQVWKEPREEFATVELALYDSHSCRTGTPEVISTFFFEE